MRNGMMFHRTLAVSMMWGLVFAGVGARLAMAAIDQDQVHREIDKWPPELREIALKEVLPKLERAERPDATPAQRKQAAEVMERIPSREKISQPKERPERVERVERSAERVERAERHVERAERAERATERVEHVTASVADRPKAAEAVRDGNKKNEDDFKAKKTPAKKK